MRLIMEGWRDYLGLSKEAEPEEELEPEEEDEEESQEAKLVRLALHKDEANRDQALMMFEMLADGLDLDLLASELDSILHSQYEESFVSPATDPFAALLDWASTLKFAETFISGGGINRELRLSQDLYKLGSAQDMIADELRKTTSLWRER